MICGVQTRCTIDVRARARTMPTKEQNVQSCNAKSQGYMQYSTREKATVENGIAAFQVPFPVVNFHYQDLQLYWHLYYSNSSFHNLLSPVIISLHHSDVIDSIIKSAKIINFYLCTTIFQQIPVSAPWRNKFFRHKNRVFSSTLQGWLCFQTKNHLCS